MMMPKMFLMLALLAHGAVSLREPEKVEKKPRLVKKFKGWIARKLGKKIDEVPLEAEKVEKEIRQVPLELDKEKEIEKKEIAEENDEELVDYVQKRVRRELGISATPHQVEELIRTMRARTEMKGVTDFSEMDMEGFRWWVKFHLPLNVGASAVAFCGELVKAISSFGSSAIEELPGDEKICSQVLTGDLATNSAKWAMKAAEVAKMDGQQHPFGRLDGVAWKHSLTRVCHDECEALVQGIHDKARELAFSTDHYSGAIEDACAAKVVKHVEAEILGCCSKSCGWNGQFCSFFPFLSSKEQLDWQSECCSERNILHGSSRQRLCDSTLSEADKIKSQNLTDQRPNEAKDREILGQDESPASLSWSLMERSFGGSLENTTCPPPIDLHKIYKQLFDEWKRMPLEKATKVERRCKTKDQPSIDECKSFLLKEIADDEGRKKYNYICWDDCGLMKPDNPELLEGLADPVKDEAMGTGGFLFVHKEIYSAWKWT